MQTFCGLKEIEVMVMELWQKCQLCVVEIHDFKKNAFISLPGKPRNETRNIRMCTSQSRITLHGWEEIGSITTELYCENQLCMIKIL